MTEQVLAELAKFAAAEDGFGRVLNTLEKELIELDGTLHSSLSEWSGEAKDAYVTAHAHWRAAAQDMSDRLAWLHRSIISAHRNYHHALRANLQMWRAT